MKSPSLHAYLLIIVILITANFNIQRWKDGKVIQWDIIGYYAYLPSTFIYGDYKLKFLDSGKPLDESVKFWPLKAENGNYLNKYTMGMSVMYAPFFFIAHIQSQIAESNANGFSWYYQKYIHLSCLLYLFLGLFYLRKLLLLWYEDVAVAISLIAIVLGTNLFYNSTTEAAMSHAYSFSLAAIFMFYVVKWFDEFKLKYAILTGMLLGLLILVRPVNILFILFPLFYGTQSLKDPLKNIRILLSRPRDFFLAGLMTFLILLPQILYWKTVTGQFLYFSYIGERFFFLNPMILQGLLSFRNGWLIYTPVMCFSIIGCYYLYKQNSPIFSTLILILIIYIYIAFSWWCWWYVGFGNRAMIDLYSLLAIPMTAFFQNAWKQPIIKRNLILSFTFLFIGLNLFQTQQYRMGLIHFDSMNMEAYLSSFGKLHYTEAYKTALKAPDYEKAKQGVYE